LGRNPETGGEEEEEVEREKDECMGFGS